MTVNYTYALKATYEPLRVVEFGDIGAGFTEFGAPLSQIGRLLTFKNNMDADIYISFDGVNDHEWIPAASFDKCDYTSNKASVPGGFLGIPANTQIWIRYGAAPSAGQVTLSVVYGASK